MRKFLVILTFLLIFVFSTSYSLAQTSSPIPVRTTKGQQVRNNVSARNEEQRQVRATEMSQKRQGLIEVYFGRMMDRFEAAIERLEILIERIQTRINIIKEEDSSANVTKEQASLDSSKTALDAAKEKMDTLKTDFGTLLTSDEPIKVFKTVGEDVRDLKQDLVKIHTSLVKIIGDIQGLRVGQRSPKPTQTP